MDYQKRYFEKKKIENLLAGSLIAYGAHQSLVLVTDKTTTSLLRKVKHCTSLNGFSEEIPFGTEVLYLKKPIADLIRGNYPSLMAVDMDNNILERAYKLAYPSSKTK